MNESVQTLESPSTGAREDLPVNETPRVASKKIWIDLDNSPHVPFFLPIIDELQKRGHTVVLTARDSYQVVELLKLHHINCRVLGKHWGKNRVAKIVGTFLRAMQLSRVMKKEKVDLAISHVSRSQFLSSVFLGVQSLTISDYEFIAKVGSLKSDWVFTPEFIPPDVALQPSRGLMQYPGLKEDVYVPRFRPGASLRTELGINPTDLVVTVRPPATEAHYHNHEGSILLDGALKMLTDRPATRVILLPRSGNQEAELRKQWAAEIEARKIIIPAHVVDGLNLIWSSDLVISGGGTMNREAAALGVPVYSIFRGRIGGVDRYLAASGRLVMIEKPDDLRTKIKLEHRKTEALMALDQSPALEAIIEGISSIVEHQRLPASRPDARVRA